MAGDYRFIGKKTPRKDAREIVTGAAAFLGDLKMLNLLHGKVLRSPYPHAIITRIDKSKGLGLPGVKAVLTYEDAPDWKGGTPRLVRVLDRRVRFVGDAVALVAATTESIAEEACRLIDVKYEVLPAVLDMEEAQKEDAPQLYEEFPRNVVTPGVPFFGPKNLKEVVMGDVQQGFEMADAVTEGTFGYENMPNPIPPEPPGAIALWEEPNKLTLWVTTQGPYMDKILLWHIMGRKVDVRTFGGHCGGSYGSKQVSWLIHCYAALLSKATGKPVKLFYTKEEHMAAFVVRPASRISGRVGMKKDGTVTAVAGTWLIDTGYYTTMTQSEVAVGCGEVQIAVRCPNWDLKPVIVCTNRNASGPVRGFGGQELKSALIPLLSLAMEKLDLDPFEVLKKNFVKPGQGYFWRDGIWYTYRGVDYSAAMDKGAEVFGWKEKWKGWLKPSQINGSKLRGIGVGAHGNADIGEDASEAHVRLHPDGTAVLFSCLSEPGTGQRTNHLRWVAETLQIPVERVSLSPPDSLINPYEFGAAGSRGTYAVGTAAIYAAENALEKLFELAAPMLDSEPGELETIDGVIFSRRKPEKKVPWKAAMGVDRTLVGYGRFEPDHSLTNCIVSFAEVEVDTETGKVSLVRVVNATDAGKIIDPQGIEGQLNGCLGSAGMDTAIFEEMVLDRSTGRMVNCNMVDYKWRTFSELPAIDNVVLETPFPTHRFHAVGVGEVATSPGPSAVLMAVSNAVGVWLHEYPLTPDKVLRALRNRGDERKEGAL